MTDTQHQALSFVGACNRNQYQPTADQVVAWLASPAPADARYETRLRDGSGRGVAAFSGAGTLAAWASTDVLHAFRQALGASYRQGSILRAIDQAARALPTLPTSERVKVADAETAVAHLCRIGWLTEPNEDEAVLQATPLGVALLREAERSDIDETDVSVVVLGREDPLAYPTLIDQLASVGAGLLVDPYLRLDQVHQVVVSTGLTRVLLSGKSAQFAVRAALSTYLDSPSLSRPVEVRGSCDLHDRLLLADDGKVYTLGTSLNGVGRTTTVFSPLPSVAAATLQEEYNRLWAAAELVGPAPADQTGTSEDDKEEPDRD